MTNLRAESKPNDKASVASLFWEASPTILVHLSMPFRIAKTLWQRRCHCDSLASGKGKYSPQQSDCLYKFSHLQGKEYQMAGTLSTGKRFGECVIIGRSECTDSSVVVKWATLHGPLASDGKEAPVILYSWSWNPCRLRQTFEGEPLEVSKEPKRASRSGVL
jgi:hypothetical protein